MEDNLLDEEDKSSVTYLLSEILKKYGLEEDPDRAFEKIEKFAPTNGDIASKICSDLAKNLVSEPDAALSLTKNLGMPEEKAKQIITEIKNIVLPPLKEFLTKRAKIFQDENTKKPVEKNSGQTFTPPPTQPKKDTEIMNKEKIIRKAKTIKKFDDNLKSIPQQKQTRGPDNYREPIE